MAKYSYTQLKLQIMTRDGWRDGSDLQYVVIATVYISVSRLLDSKLKSNTNFNNKQINFILKNCKHLGSSLSEDTEALMLTKMTQWRDALFAEVGSKIKYARHSLLGQVHFYFN